MKLLSSGSDTGKDLNAGAVDIPLNSTTTNYVNTDVLNGQNVKVLAKFTTLTIGAVITYQVKVGAGAATAQPIPELSGSFTVVAVSTQWQSKEIAMSKFIGSWDLLEISFQSDNAGDTDVDIITEVYNLDMTDENGRVNLGKALDTDVTLTNDQLDVNAASVGGATPINQAGQARTNRFSN